MKAVLNDGETDKESVNKAIDHVLSNASGSPSQFPHVLVAKVRLANRLADMTNGNADLVREVMPDDDASTLREVADRHHIELALPKSRRSAAKAGLASGQTQAQAFLVAPATPPTESGLSDDVSKRDHDLQAFQSQLFQAEPSAVLRRMVLDKQVQSTNLIDDALC